MLPRVGSGATGVLAYILKPSRESARLSCALNAVFAGRLDQIWAVRWRLRWFHLLTRLQEKIPLVPREDIR